MWWIKDLWGKTLTMKLLEKNKRNTSGHWFGENFVLLRIQKHIQQKKNLTNEMV